AARSKAPIMTSGQPTRPTCGPGEPAPGGGGSPARPPRGRRAAAGARPPLGTRAVAATLDARLPLAGRHNAWHAAAASAVGLTLGVPLDEAAAALALAAAVKGRLGRSQGGGVGVAVKVRRVVREAGGVRILDDTYNANPVSVRAALDALREAPGGGRRAVVFRDHLALGCPRDA